MLSHRSLMLAFVLLFASPPARGGWMDCQAFTASDGQAIHYYLFTPKDLAAKRKYPLVIWLHGGLKSNGRGGPNLPTKAFYQDKHQKAHPCFVLRPVAVKGKNWVSPRGAGAGSHKMPAKPAPSVAALAELLEKTLAANPIDPNRVHVVGASMGGYGVWDVITRWPHRFASAMPICGGGDPSQAERIKGLKIWIAHSADDRIVPVRGSREMFAALMKARGEEAVIKTDDDKTLSSSPDGRIRYTEYRRGGHNAWDRAMGDPGMLRWVFQPEARKRPVRSRGPAGTQGSP